MNKKLICGVIGTPDAMVDTLRDEFELVPYGTAKIEELGGIIISGADATVSRPQLEAFFAAGLSVAVAGVGADVLAVLEETAGSRPIGASSLLVYSPVPGSAGTFHLASAGESDMVMLQVPPEPGIPASPVMEAPAASQAPPPARTGTSYSGLFSPAPPHTAILQGDGTESFIPPGEEVAFGTREFNFPFSTELGRPACDKWIDMWVGAKPSSQPQALDGNVKIKFYCYWVDGGNDPHFIVIARQSVYFNPALRGATDKNIWSWHDQTKGFLFYSLDYQGTKLTAEGATDISLIDWAPKLNFDDTNLSRVSHEMSLRCKGAGAARSGRISFKAQCDIPNSFSGWSGKTRVNAAGKETAWQFHERTCWDPTVQKPEDFPSWWADLFKYNPRHHGFVREDWPQQSWTPITTNTIGVWRVNCTVQKTEGGSPKPSKVKARFSGSALARLALFHNSDCCKDGHHQAWYVQCGAGFSPELELDVICKTTG